MVFKVLGGAGVGEWGGQVMDIGERMCCGERWVLYKTNESQTYTPEASNTLYVN